MKINSHSILVNMRHDFYRLIKACETEGIDIHKLLAAKRLSKNPNEITKEERQEAKQFTFDFFYLLTQDLPKELINFPEVENIVADLYNTFDFYDPCVKEHFSNKLVSNYIGITKHETIENLIKLFHQDRHAFTYIVKDFYKQ